LNWTKFGDEYPVEARELTDPEWRTHGEALMWSNGRKLDLHVPKRDVRRFAEYDSPVGIDVVIKGLLDKGWWRDDGDTWFVGLRHPEWQRTSEEIRIDRDKAAARMRRVRRHSKGDHSLCLAADCVRGHVRANVPNERSPERSGERAPERAPEPSANGMRPLVALPGKT